MENLLTLHTSPPFNSLEVPTPIMGLFGVIAHFWRLDTVFISASDLLVSPGNA